MQTLQTFPSRSALYAAAADRLEEHLRKAVETRGWACAALSGGTTPEPAYALLAARNLDWPRVTFALVDERFVAPDHPASNEAMLRRALARPLQSGAALAPMFGPGSLADAAEQADSVYARLPIDVALMGMGADGHTASWFPGAEGLGAALDPENPRSVVALRAPEAAGETARLSLTRAALSRVPHVVLLITGADKFATLGKAMQGGPGAPPVAALFDGTAPEIFWAA